MARRATTERVMVPDHDKHQQLRTQYLTDAQGAQPPSLQQSVCLLQSVAVCFSLYTGFSSGGQH